MFATLMSITYDKGTTFEVSLQTDYPSIDAAFNALCEEFIKQHPIITSRDNYEGNRFWTGTIIKTSDALSCVDNSDPSASNSVFGRYSNVTPVSAVFQLRYN
jgi:hypothetical protein